MPMKKALLFTFLMIFLGSAAWAQDSDLFSYDRDAVAKALSGLDEAESYVTGHPGITLSEIRSSDELSETSLVRLSPVDGSSLAGEPPLGIPSFWWGCIFVMGKFKTRLTVIEIDHPINQIDSNI